MIGGIRSSQKSVLTNGDIIHTTVLDIMIDRIIIIMTGTIMAAFIKTDTTSTKDADSMGGTIIPDTTDIIM